MFQCMTDDPYPWLPKSLEAGLLESLGWLSYHPYRMPCGDTSQGRRMLLLFHDDRLSLPRFDHASLQRLRQAFS
jgi:hypothetical protein